MRCTGNSNGNRSFRRSSFAFAACCMSACLSHVGAARALTIETFDRGLRLSGEITQESPRLFSISLAKVLLERQARGDRSGLVHLHLDLPQGGLAAASFQLVDLMRSAQSHGTKFAVHVGSKATCTSGCTYLFLAANERWISPEGRLIFHGFSHPDPGHAIDIPEEFVTSYRDLLRSANKPFYDFFDAARIIEDNKIVGFTGRTLFRQDAFSGLITGLESE